jgi:hypothetical protein
MSVGIPIEGWRQLLRPEGAEKVSAKVGVVLLDRLFVRSLSGWEDSENRVREIDDHGKRISSCHDSPVVGHPRVKHTLEMLARKGWRWPRMQGDVRRYMEGCTVCRKVKPRTSWNVNLLKTFGVPGALWEVMSWDLIGPLPKSRMFNAIVTMVDMKMKAIKLEPANVTISVIGAAVVMWDQVYQEKGLPMKVISDWGPQFISWFMRELYQLLGVEGNLSMVYHPQTDGQTEQVNREVEKYLWMFTNYQQDDWVDWLPLTKFSYNNTISESTGYSPFFLNRG